MLIQTQAAGRRRSRSRARSPLWRLLDTGGGVALGALLLLALQAARGAAPGQGASAAGPRPSWASGPWAGCTLLSVSQDDMTDGATTVTHQVSATWACAQPLPPALITPAAPTTRPAR